MKPAWHKCMKGTRVWIWLSYGHYIYETACVSALCVQFFIELYTCCQCYMIRWLFLLYFICFVNIFCMSVLVFGIWCYLDLIELEYYDRACLCPVVWKPGLPGHAGLSDTFAHSCLLTVTTHHLQYCHFFCTSAALLHRCSRVPMSPSFALF